jgi:hypothetical protein
MQCIIKQSLNSVFVISWIIMVSVTVINLAFGSTDNIYNSTLIILDITNSSSNNCLLYGKLVKYMMFN